MTAQEAADHVAGLIGHWLGMDEVTTKAEVALSLKHMPPFEDSVDALLSAVTLAYQEVMMRQAARWVRWDLELERQGPVNFLDRATVALQELSQ